jgi:hypothetical protein
MTRGDIVEYRNGTVAPHALGIVDGPSNLGTTNDTWVGVRWLNRPEHLPRHDINPNGHIVCVLADSLEVVGHIDE